MARVENATINTSRVLERQPGKDPSFERKKADQARQKVTPQVQTNRAPEAVQTQKGQNINKNV